MTVRTASADDLPEVLKAYDWLFAPPGGLPPGWDPVAAARRLEQVLTDERSTILVTGDAGAISGFCTVALDLRSVRFGQRAWVEDLAVDPAGRSQGLGKALLDAAKAWAAERGATHLELDSGDSRVDAHRFYEREQPSWSTRSFGWVL